MQLSATDRFTVELATELYGLDRWGNGFMTVGENGHLEVRPHADGPAIDVHETVRELAGQGLGTPMLLRFPQLLDAQVERLSGAFGRAMDEFHYDGGRQRRRLRRQPKDSSS